MKILHISTALIIVLVISACSHTTGSGRVWTSLPALQSVSGTVEAADAATEVPEIDLLAMDPEMESFLDKYVRPVRTQRQRLHMLHRSLRAAGMLNLDYEPSANGTALETFHSAQANCLSYASLFVAMARAVGLHAEFQVVDTKPEWDRRGDRLAVAIHVNAVVKLKGNERFEVDIDPLSRSRIVGTRIIDDEEALALYHNNVGMEMFLAGDTAAGYKRLVKALQLESGVDYLWANLGAIYRANGQNADAESSYRAALAYDPSSRTALNNLVVLYRSLGDDEQAEAIVQRIGAHRERNPYYHYQLATVADENGDYRLAIKHLERAIDRKDSAAEFYYLLGQVLHKMDRDQESAANLRLAIEKADLVSQRHLFSNYLDDVLGDTSM